jgi:hypothetical protein
MKLPSSIKVGCYDIAVHELKELESLSHGIHGHYSDLEHCIRINKDLSPQVLANTLIHEVLHACWAYGALGAEEEEEQVVTVLANVFTQVVQDNPELNKFILKCIRSK